MLLPLLSAVLVALSSANAGAIRAASEDSLRCAPGERRIEIAAGADPRPGYASNEELHYTAYYGRLRVGSGEMRLVGHDTVRGRSAWKAMFIIDGGIPTAHFHDTTVTWFDSLTFNSLRFAQKVHDPGYRADRDTHIFPDDKTFKTKDGEIHASVADPLDDMSLVYLVRTLPLEPGQCYVLSRYFKPESNPVVVHVVRRDTVDVPAGRFPAIMLRPEIKTTGMFGQNGHAELWLADDSARTVLQLKTSLKIGSISLKLKRIGRDQ